MSELAHRLAALQTLADVIEGQRDELQAEIVRTTKKPVRLAAGEVNLAIARLRAFPEVLPLLQDRGPVGTVAVMFPGNASLSNPVNTIGTAFLAGNEVRARFPGASRTWAERIEPLFTRYLTGVTFVHGSGAQFLSGAAGDREVAVAIVFGDDAWASDYEAQFRESGTKFIFEGPGKDPFLVLDDADVELAAQDAVAGAYYNAGQACTSPERFYVQRGICDRFVNRVVALTEQQGGWDPYSPDTTVGAIVSERVVRRIQTQLQDALAKGARLLTGGSVDCVTLNDGTPGWYVHPTVLTGATHDMLIMQDETFGPVIAVQAVADAQEALQLAAASRYGLSASLYGGGPVELDALARTHGQVFHNEIWSKYYSRHLHAPYGGRKRSGWVWEQLHGSFVHRDGLRTNALEFSRPRG